VLVSKNDIMAFVTVESGGFIEGNELWFKKGRNLMLG